MTVRHAEISPRHVHTFFLECITHVKSALEALPEAPEWAIILDV